jgi:hypothetical protein
MGVLKRTAERDSAVEFVGRGSAAKPPSQPGVGYGAAESWIATMVWSVARAAPPALLICAVNG